MPIIRASWNREIAVLLAVLLAVVLYLLIPAVCPGFPRPVVTHIYYSNSSTPDGGRLYTMDGRITNEGTRGNVLVTAQLINVTNQTPMEKSAGQVVFMMEREDKSVHLQLTGLESEPYGIKFEVQRR
jgi:hypothetical protein